MLVDPGQYAWPVDPARWRRGLMNVRAGRSQLPFIRGELACAAYAPRLFPAARAPSRAGGRRRHDDGISSADAIRGPADVEIAATAPSLGQMATTSLEDGYASE